MFIDVGGVYLLCVIIRIWLGVLSFGLLLLGWVDGVGIVNYFFLVRDLQLRVS